MGIDLLDLKFRLEKSFGLQLENDFLERVLDRNCPDWREPGQPAPDITVGQIYGDLLIRLENTHRLVNNTDQLTLECHRLVEQTLSDRFPDRLRTPETLLHTLWSRPVTADEWKALSQALAVRLPELRSTRTTIPSTVGFLVILAPLFIVDFWSYYLPIAMAGWFVVAWLYRGAIRDPVPLYPRTVAELGAFVLSNRQQSPESTWSEESVWGVLRVCIVDSLGVDDDEVTPDARLIHDLGAS